MSRNAFAQCEREYNEAEDLNIITREERKAMFKDYLVTEDNGTSLPDPVIEQVREKLLSRSQVGFSKYGVTLNRTDYSMRQWLIELQNEHLDAAGYCQRIINDLDKKIARDK